MQKCNLCYDRTSQGKGPMCTTVCPTQAIWYGTYEEWLAAGRAEQGARPTNQFLFGAQRVQTRHYVVLTEDEEQLDLTALTAQADLGRQAELPRATATRQMTPWTRATTIGLPQRDVPAEPWAPRTLPEAPPTPKPEPQHKKPQPVGRDD